MWLDNIMGVDLTPPSSRVTERTKPGDRRRNGGRWRVDYTGRRFGFLTVIGDAPSRWVGNGKRAMRMVRVRCDCGGKKTLLVNNLINGSVKGCGCMRRGRQ